MNANTLVYLAANALMRVNEEGDGGAELAEILCYPKEGRVVAVGFRFHPLRRGTKGRFVVVMEHDTPLEDREYICAAWGVKVVDKAFIPPPGEERA